MPNSCHSPCLSVGGLKDQTCREREGGSCDCEEEEKVGKKREGFNRAETNIGQRKNRSICPQKGFSDHWSRWVPPPASWRWRAATAQSSFAARCSRRDCRYVTSGGMDAQSHKRIDLMIEGHFVQSISSSFCWFISQSLCWLLIDWEFGSGTPTSMWKWRETVWKREHLLQASTWRERSPNSAPKRLLPQCKRHLENQASAHF